MSKNMTRSSGHRGSQANLAIQIALPLSGYLSDNSPDASRTSAPNIATLEQESRYLCAWLRSRLEEGLWLPREESALSCAPAQQRQLARLARLARRRGLAVWPARASRTSQQEVA